MAPHSGEHQDPAVKALYCALAAVTAFWLYALLAAVWTTFELWRVTPW